MSGRAARLEKKPLVASRLINGELLLVPVKQRGPEIRKVYRLEDPVAATVWQLIDGRRTVSEIRRRICREFEAAPGRAGRDLERFLRRLVRIGAVGVARGRANRRSVS